MEATAEYPVSESVAPPHNIAEVGKPYRMDSDRAKELIRLRWDREKAAKEAKLNTPPPETVTVDAQTKFIARQVERLQEAIDELDGQIEGTVDPDAWHKRTTARGKLFEQWRILSGIPMPGSRKPAADKPTRQRGTFTEPT